LLDDCVVSQRRAFGDGHPATLRAVTNLARLLMREGDPAGAEELLREAWARRNEELGQDHLDTLEIAYELGGLLLDTQRPEEALELLGGALGVAEPALPDTDYELARLRLRVGLAQRAVGHSEQGRALVERAQAVLLATRGPQDEFARLASEVLAGWSSP
jgi:tetratricopeptide (TPR) repeat protein